MAIVQIVNVVAVLDCGVSAARAMLMVMVSMMRFVAWAHACLLCPHGNIRRLSVDTPSKDGLDEETCLVQICAIRKRNRNAWHAS